MLGEYNDIMNKELLEKITVFLSIQKNKLGAVSTVNADGGPESALVYFTFDNDLNFYFATRDNSRKYQNLIQNPKVAFVMGQDNPPQTLQLEGIASVIRDVEGQKHLFPELVGLASAKNFSAPISQMSTGGLQFVKIAPTWLRLGNFEVRKHEDTFQEIKKESSDENK